MQEFHGYEAEKQSKIAAIVDDLLKKISPDSETERFMLGPAVATNTGWDTVYNTSARELGITTQELDGFIDEVLVQYAKKRGKDDYVSRFGENKK